MARTGQVPNIVGRFDNITLTVTKDSTYYTLQTEYYKGVVAAVGAEESEKKSLQAQVDLLTRDLETIAFSDLRALLSWCVNMQLATDDMAVTVDHVGILATFAAHGITPDMNVINRYNPEDLEDAAKHIIVQALFGLKGEGQSGHYINPVLHRVVGEWFQKFGY